MKTPDISFRVTLCVFCVFQAPVRSRTESLETLEKKIFRPRSGKKLRKRVTICGWFGNGSQRLSNFPFFFFFLMGRFYQKASRWIEGEKKLFSVIKENHLTSIAPLERYLHLVWVQKSGSSKVNWVLVSWIHFFPFSCYLLCEHPGCVRARADIQIHTLSFLCGVRLCLPLRSKKKICSAFLNGRLVYFIDWDGGC